MGNNSRLKKKRSKKGKGVCPLKKKYKRMKAAILSSAASWDFNEDKLRRLKLKLKKIRKLGRDGASEANSKNSRGGNSPCSSKYDSISSSNIWTRNSNLFKNARKEGYWCFIGG